MWSTVAKRLVAVQSLNVNHHARQQERTMWVILSDGSTFNLNTARAIRVGAAGGESDEWALVAEMPNGEDIALAHFHSPQGAQKAHDEVIKALKTEARMLDLS